MSASAAHEHLSDKRPCMDGGACFGLFLNPSYRRRVKLQKVSSSTNLRVLGSASTADTPPSKKEVQEAAKKLLYFSYRKCFAPLPNDITTDAGWGCLLRTGQMLMAFAMMRFYEANNHNNAIREADRARGNILSSPQVAEHLRAKVQPLFMDAPEAPFGVHALEKAAASFGVAYSVWLAPSQIGRALTLACSAYRASDRHAAPVTRCCVGRCIYEDSTFELLEKEGPVLYLVPVSLGIERISTQYEACVLKMLSMDSCCGIAGGKNKASLFFMGYQDKNVFYLDPHYVQKAYVKEEKTGKLHKDCGSVDVSAFQSCMLIGFYIANKAAFQTFAKDLAEMNRPLPFPLIDVSKVTPAEGVERADGLPSAAPPAAAARMEVASFSSDE